MEQHHRVPPSLEGRPVETALSRLTGRRPDHVAKLLRQRRVLTEGMPIEPGSPVTGGAELTILPAASRPKTVLPNRRIRLHVLERDEHILVLKKPSGLAMHPGPGHGTDTVLNAALALAEGPLRELGPSRSYGLVQRLDRGTSGILVIALSVNAYDGIVEQFRARTVQKEYIAFVRNVPRRQEGTITDAVDGKEAISKYRVDEVRKGAAGTASRLIVHPLTGRMHQIRIHLANLGCAIIGDSRYGKSKDELAAALYLPNFALHARSLSFRHPDSGQMRRFEVPVPGSLRRAWGKYGKLVGAPISQLKSR